MNAVLRHIRIILMKLVSKYNIVTFNLGNYHKIVPDMYNTWIKNTNKLNIPYKILTENDEVVKKYISSPFCKYWSSYPHRYLAYVKDYIVYKMIANEITQPTMFLDLHDILKLDSEDFYARIDDNFNYYYWNYPSIDFLIIHHQDSEFNVIDKYDNNPRDYICDSFFIVDNQLNLTSFHYKHPNNNLAVILLNKPQGVSTWYDRTDFSKTWFKSKRLTTKDYNIII